jgi:hypothetical protein
MLSGSHVQKKIKGISRFGWCLGRERECVFIKNHMAGRDDTPRSEVKASVTTVRGWVSEEHARSRPRRELNYAELWRID